MSKKVTSDAAAYIRSKAERRGRNVEMAEKAVVESKSFTEKEALELKLIDLVAKDVPDLLAQLDGREVKRFDGTTVTLHLAGQKTVDVRMDWRQAILSAIARPEILFLLLLGALAGLGAEISHPGLIFPGVLGVLCLILFLFASQIIPVNWAGVLLIVLAIGLFIAEVKVTSYGLLTLGGLVAMILGAMMLVDSAAARAAGRPLEPRPVHPGLRRASPSPSCGWWSRRRGAGAQTGTEGLLGQRGQAVTDLDSRGLGDRAGRALAGPGGGAGGRRARRSRSCRSRGSCCGSERGRDVTGGVRSRRRRLLAAAVGQGPQRVRARRHLPPRQGAAQAQGPGARHRGLAHRPHGAGEPADRRPRRAAPGRHHPGQRHGQGERRRLLPGHGPAEGGHLRSRTSSTPPARRRRRRCAASSARRTSTSCSPSASASGRCSRR